MLQFKFRRCICMVIIHDFFRRGLIVSYLMSFCKGAGFEIGGIHTRTECTERRAQSRREKTTPTLFRLKIRLEVSTTSPLSAFTKPPVDLELFVSPAAPKSPFHSQLPLMITPFLSVTGTKPTTRYNSPLTYDARKGGEIVGR